MTTVLGLFRYERNATDDQLGTRGAREREREEKMASLDGALVERG